LGDFELGLDQDTQTQYNYPENTIGKGAYYNWRKRWFRHKHFYQRKNDSIAQKMNLMALISGKLEIYDTIGGTK
jgi:hypothetical protein